MISCILFVWWQFLIGNIVCEEEQVVELMWAWDLVTSFIPFHTAPLYPWVGIRLRPIAYLFIQRKGKQFSLQTKANCSCALILTVFLFSYQYCYVSVTDSSLKYLFLFTADMKSTRWASFWDMTNAYLTPERLSECISLLWGQYAWQGWQLRWFEP